MKEKQVDIVILGGGVAGLWVLNALISEGYSVVLLEKQKLGQGQTICAQGIVHGGFKYVVPGIFLSTEVVYRKEAGFTLVSGIPAENFEEFLDEFPQ